MLAETEDLHEVGQLIECLHCKRGIEIGEGSRAYIRLKRRWTPIGWICEPCGVVLVIAGVGA